MNVGSMRNIHGADERALRGAIRARRGGAQNARSRGRGHPDFSRPRLLIVTSTRGEIRDPAAGIGHARPQRRLFAAVHPQLGQLSVALSGMSCVYLRAFRWRTRIAQQAQSYVASPAAGHARRAPMRAIRSIGITSMQRRGRRYHTARRRSRGEAMIATDGRSAPHGPLAPARRPRRRRARVVRRRPASAPLGLANRGSTRAWPGRSTGASRFAEPGELRRPRRSRRRTYDLGFRTGELVVPLRLAARLIVHGPALSTQSRTRGWPR